MNNLEAKGLRTLIALVMLAGVTSLAAQTKATSARTANSDATKEKIIRYVRERFNIPDSVRVTVSPFQNSSYPDYYETTLTLDDGKEKRSQKFYLSKNGRYLVEGNIFTLGADPKLEVARSISVEDQPTQGPADAPVTMVEYSDLQCPTCVRFHDFLEKEVLPRYGDKVRIVFKEFPLAAIHDWSLTAALANQCAYQIEPAAFVPLRSLIFQNQSTLNASNVRHSLLNLGEQAGIDRVKLAACMDSKASLPRVEASVNEGQTLGIASTPTTFVNGRVVVGSPEPAAFFKIVDEALSAAK